MAIVQKIEWGNERVKVKLKDNKNDWGVIEAKRERRSEWGSKQVKDKKKSDELSDVTLESGIKVKPVYGLEDVKDIDFDREIGQPG